MLDKQMVRANQKKSLAQYVGLDRETEEATLRNLLFQTTQWQNARVIAVVLSMPTELNTQPVIQRAWLENKRTVVPKIIDKHMIFVEISEQSEYRLGAMAIREPLSSKMFDTDTIDLVIVPGLAFTMAGQRLGYGAGYYDRFLSHYGGQSIALALGVQLVEWLPVEKHDQSVDIILNVNASKVVDYWVKYLTQVGLPLDTPVPVSGQFGTADMADELAQLIIAGTKTATASWAKGYQLDHEPIPKVGDLFIVLDKQSLPVAIIKTTQVIIEKFKFVDERHAYLEGEGDRTLAYWQRVHTQFWQQELAQYSYQLNEDTEVVLEQFERVF
ncbi:5-formyltetrahydrofolate cyclo-ligase [Leuconostoc rapi]|uniref:5-formyltetrahydrofolate cyclo-ligase n=1 Tax=Leuconostoc rapi TaxID=1406906 RepID=UPI0019591A51|nr:5-formyltetrahydrofolate cyclo-ligase [Leuconostoc rapi]MBM7435774.1 5-formyltetrahydrofolate cyclo-ligase [Leuconostoc rapi]